MSEQSSQRAKRTNGNGKKDHYPKQRDAMRPIRLWQVNGLKGKGKLMRWYNFVNSVSANDRAVLLIERMAPGESIEVIDIRTQKHLATHTSIVNGQKRWLSPDFRFLLKVDA